VPSTRTSLLGNLSDSSQGGACSPRTTAAVLAMLASRHDPAVTLTVRHGAAAGSPATGAAIGAGGGFLGGAAIGASRTDAAGTSVQHRYNIAYMQCMYAKGNQIPVSR